MVRNQAKNIPRLKLDTLPEVPLPRSLANPELCVPFVVHHEQDGWLKVLDGCTTLALAPLERELKKEHWTCTYDGKTTHWDQLPANEHNMRVLKNGMVTYGGLNVAGNVQTVKCEVLVFGRVRAHVVLVPKSSAVAMATRNYYPKMDLLHKLKFNNSIGVTEECGMHLEDVLFDVYMVLDDDRDSKVCPMLRPQMAYQKILTKQLTEHDAASVKKFCGKPYNDGNLLRNGSLGTRSTCNTLDFFGYYCGGDGYKDYARNNAYDCKGFDRKHVKDQLQSDVPLADRGYIASITDIADVLFHMESSLARKLLCAFEITPDAWSSLSLAQELVKNVDAGPGTKKKTVLRVHVTLWGVVHVRLRVSFIETLAKARVKHRTMDQARVAHGQATTLAEQHTKLKDIGYYGYQPDTNDKVRLATYSVLCDNDGHKGIVKKALEKSGRLVNDEAKQGTIYFCPRACTGNSANDIEKTCTNYENFLRSLTPAMQALWDEGLTQQQRDAVLERHGPYFAQCGFHTSAQADKLHEEFKTWVQDKAESFAVPPKDPPGPASAAKIAQDHSLLGLPHLPVFPTYPLAAASSDAHKRKEQPEPDGSGDSSKALKTSNVVDDDDEGWKDE